MDNKYLLCLKKDLNRNVNLLLATYLPYPANETDDMILPYYVFNKDQYETNVGMIMSAPAANSSIAANSSSGANRTAANGKRPARRGFSAPNNSDDSDDE